ncbi:Fc receptor-like protein 4 [Mustela lutreola]|uniref:Fc receptor-like protein 4 n=1 Tax=Mustela lutreola TaxID=9666 RepID=UPI002797A5F7|nr:Fc receptor-like protein 4 [Mustela lutreola]
MSGRAPGDLGYQLSTDLPHDVYEGDEVVVRCSGVSGSMTGEVMYYKDESLPATHYHASGYTTPNASPSDSGSLSREVRQLVFYRLTTERTRSVRLTVQELFPAPTLTVRPSQPTEGSSVTLSCDTQLPRDRSGTQLRASFFRDEHTLRSDGNASEFQILAIWREDQDTTGVRWPRRVPVSAVLLETLPQGGHVLAGERLVLVCSVAEGTGDTTFSWHREDTGERLGSTRQRSQRAELEIPAAEGSHTGWYYCTADNGLGLARSGALNVTVTGECRSPD